MFSGIKKLLHEFKTHFLHHLLIALLLHEKFSTETAIAGS
jgi:hypothetical protein